MRVYESGTRVGGTWYWNRYPGARFDSESYSYGYSFSEELLQEWDWSEHFAPQPETERYLNYVADKFDLRRDIRFGARITAATYDEATACWQVQTDDGQRARARFLITAIGVLSAPYIPDFAGRGQLRGRELPHRPVAQRRPGLQRQTGSGHRHRGDRSPTHHRSRQAGRPADRLSAHGELLCALAKRADRPAHPAADQRKLS